MRKFPKGLVLAAIATCLALPALAAKDSLTMGAVLEPSVYDQPAAQSGADDDAKH